LKLVRFVPTVEYICPHENLVNDIGGGHGVVKARDGVAIG